MLFARLDTQQMMAETADRLLADKNDFETRRARLSGDEPDRLHLWSSFAELGLLGALADEKIGGFGGTARDVACVLALAGKWLVVEPLLHTALVAEALKFADDGLPLADSLLSEARVIVFAGNEGSDPLAPPVTKAEKIDDAYSLTGSKSVCRNGDVARSFVVTACLDGAPALFLVDANAPECERECVKLLDGAGGASIILKKAPATLLIANASILIRKIISLQLIALCAETVGIMRALCDDTFAYLITRKQFGTPLATFQALQHRVANMHMAAEEAEALADRVIASFDEDPDEAFPFAAAAKALIDDRARLVAHDAVQLHGGMGVSDELNVSHYFKRIAAIRAEGASADILREHAAVAGVSLPMSGNEEDELSAFRKEVRAFVREALPADIAAKGELGLKIEKDDYVRWQKILYEKGWFASAWPKEFGGGGWDIRRQLVLLQEAALNNAPLIIPYGVSMVGPVLYTFGNEKQRERHLPGILSSDVWWCQGYSEPNSGSDLASLKTTAVRDGDHYVINGTKMWTTEAHWADWMHCLVRTSKDGKPQAGISFLLIDMNSPGVDVRPIVTIDGLHHTNQIFLDDVRVPVENLVGEEGQGWTIAKFLLSHERVAIADTGPKIRLLSHIRDMFDDAVTAERLSAVQQTLIADRLVTVETELATLVALEQGYVGKWAAGMEKTGPEASVLKIRGTEILQSLSEIAMMIEGPDAMVHDPADLHLDPSHNFTAAERASLMAHQYLYGRCWSIFGGTNEIQRNIIASGVLRP